MRFQHHPDGWITINDFMYSLEEFLVDEPNYQLPQGVLGREYIPGKKHYLFTEATSIPQPLEWPEGDQYLAQADQYRAAFEQRRVIADAEAEAIAQVQMTSLDKRRAEYPSVQEQLDALWAGGEYAAAMKAFIETINAKYPLK